MMRIPTTTIVPVFKMPDTTTTEITAWPIKPGPNQKGNNMITATIPPDVTFELPEGRYWARISSIKKFIKQAGSGPQDWIRFLFEVRVPGLSERFDTMAGRSFKLNLNRGSELRLWLTGILGSDFFKDHSRQELTFDTMVGMECEVELEHVYGKGYDKPLILVANLYPARPTQVKGKEVQTGNN